MYNPEISVTLDTQDTGRRQTNQNKSKQQHYIEIETMSNMNSTKKTMVLVKSRQFLLLIRYPSCYSYI